MYEVGVETVGGFEGPRGKSQRNGRNSSQNREERNRTMSQFCKGCDFRKKGSYRKLNGEHSTHGYKSSPSCLKRMYELIGASQSSLRASSAIHQDHARFSNLLPFYCIIPIHSIIPFISRSRYIHQENGINKLACGAGIDLIRGTLQETAAPRQLLPSRGV